MSFSRFFGFGFLLFLLLAVLKAVFLKVFALDNLVSQTLYGFLTVVVSMACARRLGVINYLEAALVAFLWTAGVFVGDFLLVSPIVGFNMFSHWSVWGSYPLVALSIFLFHKKRHVQIRRELHAHHHAGHDGGQHKSHGDHSQQPHGQHGPGKHH